MNVYDFDGTIYSGDSTADFYMYCLKKYPAVLKSVPRLIFSFVLYILKIYTKTEFKENMYRFLLYIPDVDKETREFWKINNSKIKSYYYGNHKSDDVVISASPEFLLAPICEELKVGKLMASVVDKKSGKYTGVNCHGKEKVRRLYEWDKEAEIDEFYSDSFADTPLAELAKSAFMVKGQKIMKWNTNKEIRR